MAKHRTHSIEFKRRVPGRRVAPALAKRHGISRNLSCSVRVLTLARGLHRLEFA
jgi:hypothetical protein